MCLLNTLRKAWPVVTGQAWGSARHGLTGQALVQCSAVQCSAVQLSAVQCSALKRPESVCVFFYLSTSWRTILRIPQWTANVTPEPVRTVRHTISARHSNCASLGMRLWSGQSVRFIHSSLLSTAWLTPVIGFDCLPCSAVQYSAVQCRSVQGSSVQAV
jgi:hypothetical protein